MKKLKKELVVKKINNTDLHFSKARFVDVLGRSTCFVESTHTVYKISQKHNNWGYSKSRKSLKRFWYPTKLRYRYVGKSYRVRVKDGVMFLRFNKAHLTTLFHSGNKLNYFKNKGFWLRMWKKQSEVDKLSRTLDLLRPRNIFTSRGIWKRNKLFLKKKGKVSGYR